MKVLAVDDDPVAFLVIEAALRSLGHEAVRASDGNEAWPIASSGSIRVVVSDWTMPGMDGLELCRRIRKIPNQYVYFILLTKQPPNEANLQAALDAGVDDFLPKPVNVRDLRMRLHVGERILSFMSQVRQLGELIPVCSYCKKVRDDQQCWQALETFIGSKTGSRFSHGICPVCYDAKVVPMLNAIKPG